MAQGLLADQESSYRLYLETIFEDVSRELRALFDPRDPASLLWPKRAALLELPPAFIVSGLVAVVVSLLDRQGAQMASVVRGELLDHNAGGERQ